MKKIILISLFSLMFSQTEMTTKAFSVYVDNTNGEDIYIDIEQVIGSDIPYGNISFLKFDGYVTDVNNTIIINIWNSEYGHSCGGYFQYTECMEGFCGTYTDVNMISHFEGDCDTLQFARLDGKFVGDFIIAITAPFPEEDTGYIEEGFDFCLVPGNNLVAFPCDNPVSVETAIPELAQAEIEQIIGAGQAATNLNGQFIGSLSNFTPGAGYWFKSSSSMCFNYTCAE